MFRIVIAVLCFGFSGVAMAAPQSVVLSVATMACGPDPHMIKQALEAVPGVIDVQIMLENKTAMVSFDNEKSSVEALLQAIGSVGHAAIAAPKN